MYFRHHIEVWERDTLLELAVVITVSKSNTTIEKIISCLFGEIGFWVIDEVFTDKTEIVNVDLSRFGFRQYLVCVCIVEVIRKTAMYVVFYFHYSGTEVLVRSDDNEFPFFF